ncbi:MAG: methionine--tRNA ligase [Vicinamibacterales bacterium]|nr:methionine--tRNA ligase [Vicinamibacterales bacterium]
MRFFLTTAIDYVNNRPHLGTAYEKITADVIARYKRLAGFETRFLMGNDEHSQNVFRRAQEQGKTPLAYCDEMEQVFRDVWRTLDISFDDFIRTTDARRHRPAVQRMVERCREAGDIYEGVYEGWYCVGCEAFKQEKDLVEGNCPIHQTPPEWIREKNWFFRLSKYQQPLLAHYAAHPAFIEPEVRRNEILRLVEAGLEDISVSRAGQSWGIPLPFDPESVVYVWFDALVNYAAAVGYGWDEALCAQWWPADLHVIGKDITRFHCVIWPAMLMSAGLALPKQVFGHGWVFFKGERMSKSLGNIVDPLAAAERFGPDPLRLYLVKEVPYGGDGDFSWDRFEEKYNADLANNLGNLVNRVAAMTERYRGGRLTGDAAPGRLAGAAAEAIARYRPGMDRFALHEGAGAAFDLINATNLYIADTQPWAMAKDPARAGELTAVLYDAAEAVRIAAVLLLPIMPSSAAEVLRRMGETREASQLRFDADTAWRREGDKQILNAGALWPRLEAEPKGAPTVTDPTRPETPESLARVTPVAPEGTAGLGPTTTTEAPAPPGNAAPPAPPAPAAAAAPVDRISIDDFMKVQLRVGKILEAERVPKSKKLMKLLVDAGTEQRTIVAGIAESYEAEALVGRSIVFVANLQPAKLMGIESNGMVLAASPEDGGAILLNPDPATPGTRVR